MRLEVLPRRERRQPADPPGAPRQARDGVGERERVAALETVGDDEHRGAARIAGEARHGEEGLQRVADAGAAVPVADNMRGARERLLAPFQMHRPRHPRQPRAEGEDLDARTRLRERMGEAEVLLRARLHRAGDVDQQQDFPRTRAALEAREAQNLAVVARRVAQGAPEIDDPAAAGACATVAASARQARGRLALESAQRIVAFRGAEAALDKRLGAGRRLARFVGFVPERRLVVAALLLLDANALLIAFVVAADGLLAKEMNGEEAVEGAMALGRRRERREAGLADVLGVARTEQRDRREEGGRLLRSHGKAVGAQQRDEREKWPRGAWQGGVAHAAASAISASSRPAMKARSSSSFSATPIERLNASGQRAPP